jgi:hypothetical protein
MIKIGQTGSYFTMGEYKAERKEKLTKIGQTGSYTTLGAWEKYKKGEC